jgi:hypothetical protein
LVFWSCPEFFYVLFTYINFFPYDACMQQLFDLILHLWYSFFLLILSADKYYLLWFACDSFLFSILSFFLIFALGVHFDIYKNSYHSWIYL